MMLVVVVVVLLDDPVVDDVDVVVDRGMTRQSISKGRCRRCCGCDEFEEDDREEFFDDHNNHSRVMGVPWTDDKCCPSNKIREGLWGSNNWIQPQYQPFGEANNPNEDREDILRRVIKSCIVSSQSRWDRKWVT